MSAHVVDDGRHVDLGAARSPKGAGNRVAECATGEVEPLPLEHSGPAIDGKVVS